MDFATDKAFAIHPFNKEGKYTLEYALMLLVLIQIVGILSCMGGCMTTPCRRATYTSHSKRYNKLHSDILDEIVTVNPSAFFSRPPAIPAAAALASASSASAAAAAIPRP